MFTIEFLSLIILAMFGLLLLAGIGIVCLVKYLQQRFIYSSTKVDRIH